MIEGVVARKPRPPTAHQLAVERNRSQRTDYILDRGIRKSHHQSKKQRRIEGIIPRSLERLNQIQDPFDDSEDEDRVAHNKQALQMGNAYPEPKTYPFRERGYGGLCQLKTETDDYGEEFSAWGAAMRRATRRLDRWEAHEGDDLGVVAPIKRRKLNNGAAANGDDEDEGDEYGDREPSPSKYHHDPAETEDEHDLTMMSQRPAKGGRGPQTNGTNGHSHNTEEPDDLDDVEKDLLGYGEEGEAEGDDGEELDEVDKTLLGMDGDSDSE